MTQQISYEDVAVGMELPSLVKGPLMLKDLVKWAGAIDDYSEIHYDDAFSRARGLPGPITHGPFKSAFIAQLLTNWIGPEGVLKKLSCQYRRMDIPGDTLTCKGRVTKKFIQNGEHLVECEIWAENGKGEITTPGIALVALPTAG